MKKQDYDVLVGVGCVVDITRHARRDSFVWRRAVMHEKSNLKNGLSDLMVVFREALDAGEDGLIYSAPVPKWLKDTAWKYTKPHNHRYADPHSHQVECMVVRRKDGLYVVGMFNPGTLEA